MIPLSEHKSCYGRAVFEKVGIFFSAALSVDSQGLETGTGVFGIFEVDIADEILPLIAQSFIERFLQSACAGRQECDELQCMLKEPPDPVFNGTSASMR
jgi:hypothetical protein